MKRILIFSLNYYPRFVGGAEVAIKEITDRVASDEFEFHLLTLRFDSELPKEEKIGNVFVHRIGPTRRAPSSADLTSFPLHYLKYWYELAAVWHAWVLHRTYKFTGIWAMTAHSCGIPAGIFKALNPRVKYLLSLQEGDPPQQIERMMRPVWPLFKQGFVRADALQAISTFLASWGTRMGFSGSAEVIPNGVDVSKFAGVYTNQEASEMQEKLGKKPGDIFLVSSSRLVHKNGIDNIIAALPLLPENVHLILYGIGPDEQMLRMQASDLGITHRIRFMGYVTHDELPLILKACDIFIRPSRSEGMGNSFIEAMAAGLPVIATQEGGISDFLFDAVRNPDKETTGWAVDANAPEQIARVVREIIASPEEVKRVVGIAGTLVRRSYDWDHVALNMKTLFKAIF